MSRRYLVIRVDLGLVGDYAASKLGDQVLEFATAVGDGGATILAEGTKAELATEHAAYAKGLP